MDEYLAIAIHYGREVRAAEKRSQLAKREALRQEWMVFLKDEKIKPFARILTNAYYDAYLENERNA